MGIFFSWAQAAQATSGFRGAIHQGFTSLHDAAAYWNANRPQNAPAVQVVNGNIQQMIGQQPAANINQHQQQQQQN